MDRRGRPDPASGRRRSNAIAGRLSWPTRRADSQTACLKRYLVWPTGSGPKHGDTDREQVGVQRKRGLILIAPRNRFCCRPADPRPPRVTAAVIAGLLARCQRRPVTQHGQPGASPRDCLIGADRQTRSEQPVGCTPIQDRQSNRCDGEGNQHLEQGKAAVPEMPDRRGAGTAQGSVEQPHDAAATTTRPVSQSTLTTRCLPSTNTRSEPPEVLPSGANRIRGGAMTTVTDGPKFTCA